MASTALTLVIKNWKEDQEREKKVLEVCVGGLGSRGGRQVPRKEKWGGGNGGGGAGDGGGGGAGDGVVVEGTGGV